MVLGKSIYIECTSFTTKVDQYIMYRTGFIIQSPQDDFSTSEARDLVSYLISHIEKNYLKTETLVKKNYKNIPSLLT